MSYIDSTDVSSIWDISTEEEANKEIALRLDAIKKLHDDVLHIADRFNISVQCSLESDVIRGHNRAPEIYWNQSSQYC